MTCERLEELAELGWRLTRDGSTATARLGWEDPDDPGSGWELTVLHTSGHAARFSLSEEGLGLTERTPADARRLLTALDAARELLEAWRGELPEQE